MTDKRYNEIYQEGLKRLQLWLKYSDFNTMSCYGSKMRFDLSLGLFGYCFEMENWMNKNDFKKFVTDDEFDSYLYDRIIKELYYLGYNYKK